MTDQNKKLTIIAYYLSKFDVRGALHLGYKNISSALTEISKAVGNGNSYLKLRRDEFDVLTDSHRRGYANREPSNYVLQMHDQLKDIPFSDFSSIVFEMVNSQSTSVSQFDAGATITLDESASNTDIETIINAKDTSAKYVILQSQQKRRVYNREIIENLKKLYQYRCQICGCSTAEYGVSIVEAHHILPFSDVQNNNSDNIIILCPNHHRLVHHANPKFDSKSKKFMFESGLELDLKLNIHL